MKDPRPAPPLFLLLFISMFGFIGLTLLIFLWRAEAMNEPPLFFKVFGSFIAIAFMIMGFGLPLTVILQKARAEAGAGAEDRDSMRPVSTGYKCPNCGAGIGKQEVSPSGDVKCAYCHRWYNIHGKIS